MLQSNSDIFLAVILTTLLVLLLIAGIIITFFISGRQRIKDEMKLAQAKLDFEKELRQVETEVSEHVMGQFAQELHDNIGQLLTAMHIHIENQKLDYPTLSESFKPVEIYLDEVNQQLRLLSRTLNNDYLGHIGLLGAIQVEVDRLKLLRRFEVNLKVNGNVSNLGKKQELMVFRIFQEIVQNALRHSNAKNFSIELNCNTNEFELWVKDDGKGFLLEEILQSQKASGLRNILKRSKLAGLDCKIESRAGNGSTYKLKKVVLLD